MHNTSDFHELYLLGCRPSLFPFIRSVLLDRRYGVKYHTVSSNWDYITRGELQAMDFGRLFSWLSWTRYLGIRLS